MSSLFMFGVFAISIDCPALLSFASGLGMATQRTAMYNNLNAGDCCNKNGVACIGARVTSITWNSLGLNGNINGTALNLLTELTFIEMIINSITGQLPKSLPDKITHMNFGNNQFSGPITSLPSKIQVFHCDQNNFSGVFPKVPDTMYKMNIILNSFSGPIYFKSPSMFMMQYNQISRVYIEDISKLSLGSSYDSPGFCEMGLSQVYSTQIAYLTSVCQVSGSYNTNTECGVVQQIASDLKMDNKTSQSLKGNCCLGTGIQCDTNNHVIDVNWSNFQLNGTLDMTKIELLYPYLQSFNISNNRITGSFSSKFNSNISSLDLSNNKMSGGIGNPVLNKLQILNLDRNLFNGSLGAVPPKLNTLILSNNNFDGIIPFLPLTINIFDISYNSFIGNVSLNSPKTVNIQGNLISDVLFTSTSGLVQCDLRQNSLVGPSYPTICLLKDASATVSSVSGSEAASVFNPTLGAMSTTKIARFLSSTVSVKSTSNYSAVVVPDHLTTTSIVPISTATISPVSLFTFQTITYPTTFSYFIKILSHFVVSGTLLIQVTKYLLKRGIKKTKPYKQEFSFSSGSGK